MNTSRLSNGDRKENKIAPRDRMYGGAQEKMHDEATLRYKAAKYHYKNQHLLQKNFIDKGLPIPKPEIYSQFLQPFRG